MSIASVLSLSAGVVCGLIGVIGLYLARAMKARGIGWFAFAAFMGTFFGVGNVVVGLEVQPQTTVAAARVTLCAAGLHGVGWYLFDIESTDRRASFPEKLLIAGTVMGSLASLVPGWSVSQHVVPREAWFGLVYRDAMPTTFGMAVYGYDCFAMSVLVTRYAVRVFRGERRFIPNLAGLGIILTGAILDSLAASQVTRLPYVCDICLMLDVLGIGTALAVRFVETTRALEKSAQALAETQRELVQRERLAALGEMSAAVAHEVRNPLAVMLNALSALRRELGKAPQGTTNELFSILHEEIERLRRLVDDFLNFARPIHLRLEPVDVQALLHSASELASAGTESPHRVVCSIDDALPNLRCDQDLLRHAVANLIANALQSEGKPFEVTLRAEYSGGELAIKVVDHGPGIEPSVSSRLFEPFFSTRAQGTGLGLSIVKRIVEAHRGAVTIEDTEGGGATFIIRLPVAAPDDASSTHSRRAA